MSYKPFYMLILLISSFELYYSQQLILRNELANYDKAASLSVNPAGFIFISDLGTNEIIKADTTGQELQRIGGYGWDNLSFDEPNSLFANTLNVYVADKNNNRIQIFDKDLNYLTSFSTQNATEEISKFMYPSCVEASPTGEIFILDSYNSRIVKYSSSGKFILVVGGFDAGTFALNNPSHFALDDNLNIGVIDGNRLLIFDQFGNGIKIIKLPFVPAGISKAKSGFLINSKDEILISGSGFVQELFFSKESFIPMINDRIVDAALYNNSIFILTEAKLFTFSILRN